MIRSASGTVLLLLAVTTLMGCTGPSSVTPDSVETYLAVQSGPSPDALAISGYEGTLALSDQGCWGAGTTNIVFPHGTTIQPDASGLLLADGTEIELGKPFVGGAVVVDDYTQPLPEQCEGGELLIFYP